MYCTVKTTTEKLSGLLNVYNADSGIHIVQIEHTGGRDWVIITFETKANSADDQAISDALEAPDLPVSVSTDHVITEKRVTDVLFGDNLLIAGEMVVRVTQVLEDEGKLYNAPLVRLLSLHVLKDGSDSDSIEHVMVRGINERVEVVDDPQAYYRMLEGSNKSDNTITLGVIRGDVLRDGSITITGPVASTFVSMDAAYNRIVGALQEADGPMSFEALRTETRLSTTQLRENLIAMESELVIRKGYYALADTNDS